ncbi:hypothetical protein SKAU_G00047940 [Synaphobranchus kaupii]|uniref:Uncharacterized protein n=1 Tax=Synaphobranchus kaupii TaxID=118154 RepID=A0A9Q1G3G1_SYNKA|nr:hypothetical protein SKAU_G00047940 [Synaphobranchus kaupii]
MNRMVPSSTPYLSWITRQYVKNSQAGHDWLKSPRLSQILSPAPHPIGQRHLSQNVSLISLSKTFRLNGGQRYLFCSLKAEEEKAFYEQRDQTRRLRLVFLPPLPFQFLFFFEVGPGAINGSLAAGATSSLNIPVKLVKGSRPMAERRPQKLCSSLTSSLPCPPKFNSTASSRADGVTPPLSCRMKRSAAAGVSPQRVRTKFLRVGTLGAHGGFRGDTGSVLKRTGAHERSQKPGATAEAEGPKKGDPRKGEWQWKEAVEGGKRITARHCTPNPPPPHHHLTPFNGGLLRASSPPPRSLCLMLALQPIGLSHRSQTA